MDFVPPPSVVGQNPLLLSTPVLNVMDNMKLDLIPSNQRLNNKKKMLIVRYNYQLSSFISCCLRSLLYPSVDITF